MPAKTGKRKASARRKAAPRVTPQPDPLRRKLHDLANTLEAISLAGQFIERRPELVIVLEKLTGALRHARTTLHQMDAEWRGVGKATHRAAAR